MPSPVALREGYTSETSMNCYTWSDVLLLFSPFVAFI